MCVSTGYRFPDFDRRAAQVLNPAEVSSRPKGRAVPLEEVLMIELLYRIFRRRTSWRRKTVKHRQLYVRSRPFGPCKSLILSDAAQKLQELIRRGSPKDLAAAQELMKIMAGAVCPNPGIFVWHGARG